jgi:hypothetical protein
MKTYVKFLIVVIAIAMSGCAQGPTPTSAPESATATLARPAATSKPQTFQSLQLENDLPQTRLSPRPSQELPDNHIGAWFEDYGRYYDTDFVYRNGFKRIRIGQLFGGDADWSPIVNMESIPTEVDTVISEYADNGVEIVLNLAVGSGVINYTNFNTSFQSEQDITHYKEFVSFVVSHLKGRIHYYEILNETGYISVETYANLIRQVVPVIREEDKNAKIIIGAMWGRWEFDYPGYGGYARFSLATDYLNELLRSGVVDMVDGISWHPFYDNIPGDPYYQNYPQMVQGIKDLAVSQGFTGEYFADEILWTTQGEVHAENGPPVNQLIAAKYYTRAITEHRGLSLNVTINTFFIQPERGWIVGDALRPIRNLNDTLAGAEPTGVTLSVQTIEHANVRHYAFVLPNGDRLVALWTNDEAVEDDPGVNATLTIPGSSAQKVIGVDVVNSFEQELIAEAENGNLVIRNLLVKDYPIILRFVGPRFAEPPERTVEPVTIKLKLAREERIPAGTPIQLSVAWMADTEEQVVDFLAAVDMTGTLDGKSLPNLNSYWGEIKPYEGGAGGQGKDYLSQWLYLLGVLSPGTHTVEVWLTLDRPVTDGYDSNKDGQPDEYSGEIWRFSFRIEVY